MLMEMFLQIGLNNQEQRKQMVGSNISIFNM